MTVVCHIFTVLVVSNDKLLVWRINIMTCFHEYQRKIEILVRMKLTLQLRSQIIQSAAFSLRCVQINKAVGLIMCSDAKCNEP